ncbi:hypothetical protein Pd630_LPD09192 (plasmid) [Rhodococcus opacus PD630]|nr:hypothetical protein Pd630_LPD09192 [Rhodococcus opacus PD630]
MVPHQTFRLLRIATPDGIGDLIMRNRQFVAGNLFVGGFINIYAAETIREQKQNRISGETSY